MLRFMLPCFVFICWKTKFKSFLLLIQSVGLCEHLPEWAGCFQAELLETLVRVALSCAPGAAFVLADICTVEWADKTVDYWSPLSLVPLYGPPPLYLFLSTLKMTVWAVLSAGSFFTFVCNVYLQSVTHTIFFLNSYSVFDDLRTALLQ